MMLPDTNVAGLLLPATCFSNNHIAVWVPYDKEMRSLIRHICSVASNVASLVAAEDFDIGVFCPRAEVFYFRDPSSAPERRRMFCYVSTRHQNIVIRVHITEASRSLYRHMKCLVDTMTTVAHIGEGNPLFVGCEDPHAVAISVLMLDDTMPLSRLRRGNVFYSEDIQDTVDSARGPLVVRVYADHTLSWEADDPALCRSKRIHVKLHEEEIDYW